MPAASDRDRTDHSASMPARGLFSVVVAALLALFLLAGPLHAQDAAAPADLSLKALQEQAQAAWTAVETVQARRAELRERLAPITAELEENAVALQAFTVPEVPALEVQPVDPVAVQGLIDAWSMRKDGLESLQTLLKTRQDLAAKHRETALLLADELGVLAGAQERLQPLATSLAERLESGAAKPDALPEALQPVTSWEPEAELAAAAARWRGAGERDAVIAAEAEAQETALTDDHAAAEAALETAGVWLAEARKREALRTDYAERSAADLLGAFNLQMTEVTAERSALKERLAGLAERQDALAGAKAELAALTAPTAETVEVKEPGRTEALRTARRGLALATATAAFRKDQGARIDALKQQTVETAEAGTAVIEAAQALLDKQVALEVLAEVLRAQPAPEGQTLPEAVDPAGLRQATRALQDRIADLTEQAASLAAEAEALDAAAAETKAALAAAEKQVAEQTRTVKREEEWASFLGQMQDRTPQEVRAAFEQAVAAVETTTDALERAAGEAETAAAALAEAEKTYASHYNPVVLAMRRQDDGFQSWLLDQGLRTADTATPASEGGAETAAAGPETTGAAGAEAEPAQAAAGAAPSKVRDWLAAQRQRRDQLVVRRLQYYREHAENRAALMAALVSAEFRLQREREAVEQALSAARQAWGAATLLHDRQGQDGADATLVEGIDPWLDRQKVLALQDRVSSLSKHLDALAARRAVLVDAPQDEAMADALEDWDSKASLIIERFSDYLSLRQQAAALDDIDALDELERRILDREIEDRMAQEQGVFRELGYYFGSQESRTIDELLNRYYTRLIVLERKIGNIENRQAQIDAVAKLTEDLRTTLTEIGARLAPVVKASEQALARELVLVKAALAPAQAADLLAAYAAESGVTLDAAQVPKLPSAEDAEALATARADLIEGLRDDWARVAGYRAWADYIQSEVKELGGIDEREGQYRDLKAELESAKAELKRTAGRLAGYAPSEMEKLLSTGSGVASPDADSLSLGEIGLLQVEREHILQWRMVESGISLVLIPVVALILMLLVRGASHRMVKRATRKRPGEDEISEHTRQERELRALTLAGIFRKVTSAVIAILAAIYMLKVINIDVTPIIASLGVLGLAVAFGAQAIMRDVFSGFFMLLENQVNEGDWITVNGKTGQVEGIGLRTTIVRDWHYGSVHYFPNGQITHVTSWSRGWNSEQIKIPVVYEHDPDAVMALIERVMAEMKADPVAGRNIRYLRMEAKGPVDFDLERGVALYRVHIGMNGGDWSIGRDFRQRLVKALRTAGIRLAVPHAAEYRATFGDTAPNRPARSRTDSGEPGPTFPEEGAPTGEPG